MNGADPATAPANHQRRPGSAFWIEAYVFLVVMAFGTLPSPLYGLYRIRDHLSAIMITVVYAIFAGGTIAALLGVSSIAARIGRRGVMVGAVGTMLAAAALLAAWKALPALLIGRLLTGVALGLAAGDAFTYLIELRLRADPHASMVRARNVGTSVSVGALGLGPLVAGGLAQWVKWPLTVPYLVWVGLGVVALAGLWFVPETGAPPGSAAAQHPARSGRPRLPVPAAAGTMAAFAANGLFAGLAGLFLSTILHHPAHVLSGASLFIVFGSGVVAQPATNRLPASNVLASGTVSMLGGLALLVISVRLPVPNLALFLIGGGLVGAGSGLVFKGTTGIVLETSAPEDRLAMTSALLIALYVGLSVPVIGAGIALNQGASAPNTVLWFAVLVALGVSASGWALLWRHQPAEAPSA